MLHSNISSNEDLSSEKHQIIFLGDYLIKCKWSENV